MKNFFIVNCLLFSAITISAFNEEKYKEQAKEGWLLGHRYAAQMRQNCNHLLLSSIFPPVESKDSLLESEKERFERALRVYEAMKCSDKFMFDVYSYEQSEKEDKK